MRDDIRREIVLHAIRWTANILGEVLSNHRTAISTKAGAKLSEVTAALWDVERFVRTAKAHEGDSNG